MIEEKNVIGVSVNALTWDDALACIATLARSAEGGVVCICNVHSLVTARRDPVFMEALNSADLRCPDGAPVAWALRQLGIKSQERINGPDLMLRYLAIAESSGEGIYLYGSSEENLYKLRYALTERFPALRISGWCSPPFRELTDEEDLKIIRNIQHSGATTVWVSLGCPKQELWMTKHRKHINAVLVGVGAAFDYHSGSLRRAPVWMQKVGFEWLFRLMAEPRRLWKRYLITNTLFCWFYIVEKVTRR